MAGEARATRYKVVSRGGAFAHTPGGTWQNPAMQVHLEQGTVVPDWVPAEKTEHLLSVGLIAEITDTETG